MLTNAEQYQKRLTTAEQIAAQIQPGWNCCSDVALANAKAISDAIGERVKAGGLSGISMYTMLDLFPMPCYDPALKEKITGFSWFSGAGARASINAGIGDVMPCYYRDGSALYNDYIDVDVYYAVVSPMDKHGYFSTGCSASISAAMIQKAKHIYLEVNEHMPRALYAPQIHISQVTALCENHAELPVLPTVKPDDISITIGNLIAGEIPSGATLQLGIGAIPDAVGMALKDKHDLGIHSEMFTDSMVELLGCGAVNNSRKPIHKGQTVVTFALGTKRMYEYIDDNPAFEMLSVDFVNNPEIIAMHPDMMSINAALEVDFFGQVCAESMGTRHVSGTGGQADFVRGSIQSKGGKSFIAFPSTAMSGKVSRINPTLTPGAIVTTSKNDVDHIVTEYGIAKLRGRSLSQRARALIAIAHPKFRDELAFAAKKQNIII